MRHTLPWLAVQQKRAERASVLQDASSRLAAPTTSRLQPHRHRRHAREYCVSGKRDAHFAGALQAALNNAFRGCCRALLLRDAGDFLRDTAAPARIVYQIWNDTVKNPFLYGIRCTILALDVALLNQAAQATAAPMTFRPFVPPAAKKQEEHPNRRAIFVNAAVLSSR